jgi:hypothetical protein
VTALLFALFAGAAILATTILISTARRFAGAALAIGRQLETCNNARSPKPGNLAVRSHRRKARRGSALKRSRHVHSIPVSRVTTVHKEIRIRRFNHSLLLPETLVRE